MCKIILSPCRLQVEARLLLFLRGKKWNGCSSPDGHLSFSSLFNNKKNPPPLRLEKSHSEDFRTYKRWSADFACSALPPTCSGFGVQLIRTKKKKKKEKQKHHSIRQNSNNKLPGMSAASIRLSNAKSPSTLSFNVIIQNGLISRYQAEFTFHIFTENWFLFTTSNHFV